MRWIARNVVVGVLTSTVAMSVTATWEQTELEDGTVADPFGGVESGGVAGIML